MSDRGEYLGEGYVARIGPVHIFHDLSNPRRLIVMPTRYDGGETSLRRDRVQWRKQKSASQAKP